MCPRYGGRANLTRKAYAREWLESLYKSAANPSGVIAGAYSWGVSRQVEILDEFLAKYPNVPLLGTINLDGVNDPFWSTDSITAPERFAPAETEAHLDIWSNDAQLHGTAAENIPSGLQHEQYFIEYADHGSIDTDPYVLDLIYNFILERQHVRVQ